LGTPNIGPKGRFSEIPVKGGVLLVVTHHGRVKPCKKKGACRKIENPVQKMGNQTPRRNLR